MKKLLLIMFAVAALLLPCSALADDGITVLYNGVPLSFTDTEPIIESGRVMLPFRAVLEQMNAVVSYNAISRTVKASLGNRLISFSLDDTAIYSIGSTEPVYIMDVPPMVVMGRSFVPIRAMSEALGLTVGWDDETRTVTITNFSKIPDSIRRSCSALEQYTALFENPATVFSQEETTKLITNELTAVFRINNYCDGEVRRSVGTVELTAAGEETITAPLDMIVTPDRVLLNSDIIPTLQLLLGDPASSAMEVIPAGRWLYCDLGELEEYLGGTDEGRLRHSSAALLNYSHDYDVISALITAVTMDFDPDDASSASEISTKLNAVSKIFSAEHFSVINDPDGSAKVRFNPDAADLKVLLGSDAFVSYTASYSLGVDISSETIIELPWLRIESSVMGETNGLVEKIELPGNAINFVDLLHTMMNYPAPIRP